MDDLNNKKNNLLFQNIPNDLIKFLISLLFFFTWYSVSNAQFTEKTHIFVEPGLALNFQNNHSLILSNRYEFALEEDFFYQHTEGQYFIREIKNFDIVSAYRQITVNNNGNISKEYRPQLFLWPYIDLGNFRLCSRNRFEFRFRKNPGYETRYRNRLMLHHRKAGPFISSELFYNFSTKKLNANETDLGVFLLKEKFVLITCYKLLSKPNEKNNWQIDYGLWYLVFLWKLNISP